MEVNHGLIYEAPRQEDFIFGDGALGDAPINPSADWSGWLPDIEVQDLNHIEPYACVSFATLNCVETLERQEFGALTANYSDRFLATASGTAALKGNSPQTVAETLRKVGCVWEVDWAFDSTINTFEKFYATLPQRLYTLAIGVFAQWEFGHSYVPSNAPALMEALKYSPVAFTTYAWIKDDKGLYFRPQGLSDNHCVMLFGYKENEYWLVFDSYMDRNDDGTPQGTTIKKIRWDTLPMQAKRFTLHRQVVSQSWFDKFITQLRAIFGI